MHRIDEYGHQDNRWVVGNSTTGVPATVMGAAWPNAVQEELCGLVEAAGITLEKGNHTQLLAAIQTLIGGAGRPLGALLPDDQEPAENDLTLGGTIFPGDSNAWVWSWFIPERVNVGWLVSHLAQMSTAEAAALSWNVCYLVVAAGAENRPCKLRWTAGATLELGDRRIPTSPNGFFYQATGVSGGGATGATEPTWPTVAGNTVLDGDITWTCYEGGFKRLSISATPAATAHVPFVLESATLLIPAAELSEGCLVHVGFWRNGGDAHTGDLLLLNSLVIPEVAE